MHPDQYNLTKIAYTPKELVDLGIVGSRTNLYRLVNDGKLRLTKRGFKTIFLAPHVADFLASLSPQQPA